MCAHSSESEAAKEPERSVSSSNTYAMSYALYIYTLEQEKETACTLAEA